MATDRVRLNVGGQRFETTRKTLEPSAYFTVLWKEDRFIESTEEEIFIDRDGHHFQHVLSLLRDPEYFFPPDLAYELAFYGIHFEETNDNESVGDNKFCEKPVDMDMQHYPIDLREMASDQIQGLVAGEFHGENRQEPVLALIAMDRENRSLENTASRWVQDHFRSFVPHQSFPCIQIIKPSDITEQACYRFRMTNWADLLSSTYLQFSVKPKDGCAWPADLRYQLVQGVDVVVDRAVVASLTGRYIHYVDTVTKPPHDRANAHVCDESSKEVYMRLPFWFSRGGAQHLLFMGQMLPLVAMGASIIEIVVSFDTKLTDSHYKIGAPRLHCDVVYLDVDERNILNTQPRDMVMIQHQWISFRVKLDQRRATHLLISFRHPCNKLLFAFEVDKDDDTDAVRFAPIQQVEIHCHGHLVWGGTHRAIVERMAEMRCFADRFVYAVEFGGGTLNFSRFDVAEIRITFLDHHESGTFHLFVDNLNLFVTTQNHQGEVRFPN